MTRTVLLVSALALAAGCKKKIDSAKGEKLLGEKLAAAGYKLNVTCPKDVEIKKDAKFSCDAKGDDGEFSIEVTMTDDEGNVTWKPPLGLIDTKEMIEQVHKQKPDVKVECAKRLVVLTKKGETSSCAASEGTNKGKVVMTLDDPDKGAWGWKLQTE
jgi:hypothetical protein